MGARYLRCPKCGGIDDLVLIETHEEHGEADPGRIALTETGSLIPPSEFYFSVGDPTRVEIICPCGHEWRSRKVVGR